MAKQVEQPKSELVYDLGERHYASFAGFGAGSKRLPNKKKEKKKEKYIISMPILDLSKKSDIELFDQYNVEFEGLGNVNYRGNLIIDYIDLIEYLHTGEYRLINDKCHVAYLNDYYVLIHNNVIYEYSDVLPIGDIDINRLKKEALVGVILPGAAKGYSGEKDFCLHFLANADNSDNNGPYDAVLTEHNTGMPAVSFACIEQLVANSVELIANGTINFVHFLPDSRIALTKEESKNYRTWLKSKDKNKDPFNGKPGYTVLNGYWHRPATVLLRDMRKGGKTMLFGMDDGSYFGVELVDHPTTVDAAFISLIPKELRKHKFLQRQGEWFAVPVLPKELKLVEERVFEFECDVSLQRDSEESARHYVECNEGYILDNKIYANSGKLRHENGDHPNLDFTGWHTFVRNTATKSVSVDGVD